MSTFLSLHRLAVADGGQMNCLGLRLRIAKCLDLKTVFFRLCVIPLTRQRSRCADFVLPEKF